MAFSGALFKDRPIQINDISKQCFMYTYLLFALLSLSVLAFTRCDEILFFQIRSVNLKKEIFKHYVYMNTTPTML